MIVRGINERSTDAPLRRVVVVGNGMVGHHFVEACIEHGLLEECELTVIAEERRLAYDRVNLSKFFEGESDESLQMAHLDAYQQQGIEVVLGDPAVVLDLTRNTLTTKSGHRLAYDQLVLATGSRPFVPPVEGRELSGCFVYRTIDDLEAIRDCAERCRVGVVIGGGLLGLEAAKALQSLNLETHVVELAPRLMPLQVDDPGGAVLRTHIEKLGVQVHLGQTTRAVLAGPDGTVTGLEFADGTHLDADMIVFSAGIRARDELARTAGLEVGGRGGIVIDATTRTSEPNVFAIGECAAFDGRTYGLVAPGYRMAEVAAAVLAGQDARLEAIDTNTKLKLLGVDVASFGTPLDKPEGSNEVSMLDTVHGVYKKLVLSADNKLLLGGILVGDASSYGELQSYCSNSIQLPERPEQLLVDDQGGRPALGADRLPDSATICSCHNVDKQALRRVIREDGKHTVRDIKSCTKAGTGCGSCVPLVGDILKCELKRAGVDVNDHICEHFAHSRQELFHLVRLAGIRTFDEVLRRHGKGNGCEICKPAIASILASTFNEYILEKSHAGLQDTNDRYLANMQRDGTYSVVPRIAAGEVTPEKLIALGQIAQKYGLYTKITGGQRIDMFGARLDQLPSIWRELVDAGFESGHAYGKALRTVKSCVGSTWCRYGVGDSVALALRIEHRYKGLRSPHKLKGAVSGCARECAEAQGKDFGVIATENGFNLYVCGNGGMKPQHAVLLAQDLDPDTLIRHLDRFLMFYIRTADRLQRTAPWFNSLEGGIDYLRQVIIEDSLGICDELEADMGKVVDTYQCEWKTTLDDPERVRQFRQFINSDSSDPSIVFVKERNQPRPAIWTEKRPTLLDRRVRLPVVEG